MEIKRRVEFLVVTNEKYIIRKSSVSQQTTCAKCGETMLAIEQAAILSGVRQRCIFQIVETGAVHYTETEAGALMICLNSLSAFLNCDS